MSRYDNLSPEHKAKVDRIQEMRKEIRETEESLPDPFDFYDNNNKFIAKKDDFLRGTVKSVLKDGKLEYVIVCEDGKHHPASDAFGKKHDEMLPFWCWAFEEERFDLILIGGKSGINPHWSIGSNNATVDGKSLGTVIYEAIRDWYKKTKGIKKSNELKEEK